MVNENDANGFDPHLLVKTEIKEEDEENLINDLINKIVHMKYNLASICFGNNG